MTGAAARRRSLALLALSATAGDDGIPAERAIALLWPEFDAARARNNLKQVTFALRAAVGPDVFDRAAPTIRINPAVLEVDLWMFRRALVAGDLRQAVGFYRGPFLEGFHLPGLPEFEQWLEEERSRTGNDFAKALRTLAQDADAGGRHDEAIETWRRLATLEPLSETWALGLARALAASGDTAAALQYGRVYATLVRAELDVDPSTAFREEMEALRQGVVAPATGRLRGSRNDPHATTAHNAPRVPDDTVITPAIIAAQPDPAFPAGKNDAASPAQSPAGRPWISAPWKVLVSPHAPHRARSRVLALATLGVVMLTAIAGVRAVRGSTLRDLAGSGATFVLPFAVRGEDPSAGLDVAIAELLATSLDGALGIRAVAIDAPRPPESAHIGMAARRAATERIASKSRARQIIDGDVVVNGTQLRISARVRESRASAVPPVQVVLQGDRGDLLSMVDRLAAQILAGRVESGHGDIVRVASVTTASLPAAKAYFAGEEAARAGRFQEAIDNFRAAVAIDPGFALAHYGLSVAADVVGDDELARRGARAATEHADRLPARQKRLLVAHQAMQRGDIAAAEDLYSDIVNEYEADADAWFGLAETRFHLNPLRGRDAIEAREAFEHAAALDQQNTSAVVHLARIAAMEGRPADAYRLLERARLLSPNEVIGRYALHVMAMGGPSPDAGVPRSRLERESSRLPGPSVVDLLLSGGYDALERFLDQFSVPSASVTTKAYASRQRILVAAGRGQIARAFALIDSIGQPPWTRSIETRSRLAVLDFLPVDAERLRAIRDELRAWNPEPHPSDDPLDSLAHVSAHPYLRLHRLGLLSIRLGDDATALALADSLERLARAPLGLPPGLRVGETLSASIRARLAASRGRSAEALQCLQVANWNAVSTISPLESYDRLLLAQLLEKAGREDEALGYYRQLGARTAYELPLVWPAALGMARIHERRGDRREAAAHYERVAARLDDADPALRTIAADASRKAATLRR